jgi:hypothetical protein
MKISPYIIYIETQPNALLLRQNFIIRKKVGVTDGVGKATMAEPTRHERGLLGGCDAHAGSETSVGTLQAR